MLKVFFGPTNFTQVYTPTCNTLAKDDMHPKDGSWYLNKSALNWYLKYSKIHWSNEKLYVTKVVDLIS